MKHFILVVKISLLFNLVSGSANAQSENWEIRYLRDLAEKRTSGKTSFNNTVSASMYVFAIGAPVAYLVAGLASDNKDLKKTALYLTESIGVTQLISMATKRIINRPRPENEYPNFTAVNHAGNASFPSGHTAGAFAVATSLSIINPKWYVVIPSFTWASMVGYSRLYLGVHYPTDVMAGAILGAGTAWGTYKLNKWMHKSKKEKLKTIPE